MEKVLETLKSLYKGDNVVKKHLMYFLLFIIPTIAGSIKGYIDKDMPSSLVASLFIATAIFWVLSIIPWFMMSGFGIKFMNDRHNGSSEGIPELNQDSLYLGLKVFPLYIVWSVYSIILFCIFAGFASLPMLLSHFHFLGIALSILLYMVVIIGMIILTPFFVYIYIEYAKDFKYKKALFNPLKIVEYIKKSFSPTVIVWLQYALAGLIALFGIGFIFGLTILMILIVNSIGALAFPNIKNLEYTLAYIVIFVLLNSIGGVIQSYISAILGLGFSANFIEIYKEYIEENEA